LEKLVARWGYWWKQKEGKIKGGGGIKRVRGQFGIIRRMEKLKRSLGATGDSKHGRFE